MPSPENLFQDDRCESWQGDAEGVHGHRDWGFARWKDCGRTLRQVPSEFLGPVLMLQEPCSLIDTSQGAGHMSTLAICYADR